MSDYFTVRQCAEYLRVNPMTIYRMVKKGAIPYFRVGNSIRFHIKSLHEWLAPSIKEPVC